MENLVNQYCINPLLLLKYRWKYFESSRNFSGTFSDTLLADENAESLLINYFRNRNFPGIIFSEEILKTGPPLKMGDKYTVAIDPLDGSMNFMRKTRLPYSALITILESTSPKYSDAIATAVISLTDNDLWYAERGKGCFYKGRYSENKPIRCEVSDKTLWRNRESFAFIEIYTQRDAEIRSKLPNGFFRNLGSAALEMALVAEGCADGRISSCQKAHELVAGNLLIGEAGGINLTFQGLPISDLEYDFNATIPSIQACNADIAKFLLKAVS
ncbi:hypothetical protein HYW75_05360 [Candidatus Pacearchaeota archaeon]|nr:hypothetical protein [Candidatus Pacearchaeota archaeon]